MKPSKTIFAIGAVIVGLSAIGTIPATAFAKDDHDYHWDHRDRDHDRWHVAQERREREHREFERRERERRAHEWREHERRDHHNPGWHM